MPTILSQRERYAVFERSNFACFYCGTPAALGITALQVEHVLPQALGGTDDPWNLVASCQPCNLGKSDHAPSALLIRAAADLYWSYPTRRRDIGRCVDCGRVWVLNADEVLAGGDHACEACQSAWCSGYDVHANQGR
jgi:hypothetical protein